MTLSLEIQSLIARALDDNNYVLVASLDLSAAFDVVNVDLLLKRLKIMGLPDDIVRLIKIWLTNRSFYVSVNGENSVLLDIISGTVQGSILGPILYAIYISPVFDKVDMTSFADDGQVVRANKSKQTLIIEMEDSLKVLAEWLKGSGMKINEAKTELCLFYKKDQLPVEITLSGVSIRSTDSINILGVTFDSKLQWAKHISNAIKKANGALNAIKLIKKYFTNQELVGLVTSNFYSVLFYNSEVWHIPSLKSNLKQQLLSASARALKVCMNKPDPMLSFKRIHEINKRGLPGQIMTYKTSLLLHTLYTKKEPETEWLNLQFQHQFNNRHNKFAVTKTNTLRVGENILVNRLSLTNNKIPLDWLNLNYDTFKIKCKLKYLK